MTFSPLASSSPNMASCQSTKDSLTWSVTIVKIPSFSLPTGFPSASSFSFPKNFSERAIFTVPITDFSFLACFSPRESVYSFPVNWCATSKVISLMVFCVEEKSPPSENPVSAFLCPKRVSFNGTKKCSCIASAAIRPDSAKTSPMASNASWVFPWTIAFPNPFRLEDAVPLIRFQRSPAS